MLVDDIILILQPKEVAMVWACVPKRRHLLVEKCMEYEV